MNESFLLKTCKLLLIANITFWVFIAFYFSFSKFGENAHWIIKALLFMESILYFISYIGLVKNVKIIYLFAVILAFGNTILSITDQIDLSDIVSLILSGLTFISLLSIWKYTFNKKEF